MATLKFSHFIHKSFQLLYLNVISIHTNCASRQKTKVDVESTSEVNPRAHDSNNGSSDTSSSKWPFPIPASTTTATTTPI